MIKQVQFFWIVVSIFIFIFLNTSAQEQTIPIPQPPEEEPIVYKISEIPIKLEETASFLSDVYDNVLKPEEAKNLEENLTQILKNYSTLKAETDSIKLDTQLTTTLREYQQKWNLQKKEILDWSDDITSRTEKLEEQKKTLIKNKEIWLRTDSLARAEKANINIRNKIQETINAFNKAEKLTINEINNSLNLQTKLSKQIVDVDQTIKKIEDLLLAKKREIFVRNALPIWESFSGSSETTSLSAQVKNIYDSYILTTRDLYIAYQSRFISSLIYFLILLAFVLTLKHYSKNLKSNDEKVQRALKILDAPLSTAILVSLLITAIFLHDAPEVFISLIRIVMVLPLLAVLNRIINANLKFPLYLFAVLLILQQFKQTAASDTEIERALLFIINIIALAGLIWIIFTKRFDKAFVNQSYENKAKILAKIVIAVFTVTLIANILGFVMMSLTLVNGTINSTYAITLIATAALALESIIILFLHTKLASSINVVREYPEKIENALAKIIKLTVIVWATIVILNSFGVREIVYDWLGEALNYEWTIGSFSITLGNIFVFIVSIWISIIIARFVRFILEGDVLPRLNLARGVPGAISTISSYLIVGFGIVVAVMSAGIDLNSFALIAGALGVGIGFGLQNIVNNFISGLILIFERPIQIGDAVQVEELSGRVTHIGIRSSTIKTWDGAEVIVPNGNLISNKLINWTLSDQRRRIEIKVGVAYGTDVNLVMEALLECAKQNEKIIEYPAPYVLFEDFGDSSLNFELRCWATDFESWIEIRSEIRVAIDKAFKEKNIEIPFPQRDLHLKSGFDLPKSKIPSKENSPE